MKIKALLLVLLMACINGAVLTGCESTSRKTVRTDVNVDFMVSIYPMAESGDTCTVADVVLLEENIHVGEVIHYPDDGKSITIPFRFSDIGKYKQLTANNIGKRIAITLNGEVVYTPVVKMEINNGACSVVLTDEQLIKFIPDVDLNKLEMK